MAATVKIAFGAAGASGVPVFPKSPRAAEVITSSASSQQTTILSNDGEFAHVTAYGGAVHVLAGSNPTAAAASGWMVPDGATFTFGPLKDREKVAVIDV